MDLLKKIQLTNSINVLMARNELYLDKIVDKTNGTFKELTHSQLMLEDALLHFQELKMENMVLKSRNRDLESLMGSFKLYVMDLKKELKQLKDNIRNSDSVFNEDLHGL